MLSKHERHSSLLHNSLTPLNPLRFDAALLCNTEVRREEDSGLDLSEVILIWPIWQFSYWGKSEPLILVGTHVLFVVLMSLFLLCPHHYLMGRRVLNQPVSDGSLPLRWRCCALWGWGFLIISCGPDVVVFPPFCWIEGLPGAGWRPGARLWSQRVIGGYFVGTRQGMPLRQAWLHGSPIWGEGRKPFISL